jgi:dephospho-CoA kinase
MHPRILETTLAHTAARALIHFINAPLLFEAGFNTEMDKVIVVRALRSQILERGALRDGLTPNQISQRLNFQKELNETLHFADFIIDNTGLIDSTKSQVHEIWKILIKIHNVSTT